MKSLANLKKVTESLKLANNKLETHLDGQSIRLKVRESVQKVYHQKNQTKPYGLHK